MLNMCFYCGGGIRKGYTAPESLCTCGPRLKKIEDTRHDMILAESKWLLAHGWEPLDIKDRKSGFVWKNAKGDGLFSQDKAVEIQKTLDASPNLQQQYDREVMEYRAKRAKAESTDISDALKNVMCPDASLSIPSPG